MVQFGVPGAQEYGMQHGSICNFCSKPAVSICNYKYSNFTGCCRTFCRDHGICHFSPLMVDQAYLNSLNDNNLDQAKKKHLQQLQVDRNQVGLGIQHMRLCNECEPAYTAECKAKRCKNCMIVFGIFLFLFVLGNMAYTQNDKQYGRDGEQSYTYYNRAFGDKVEKRYTGQGGDTYFSYYSNKYGQERTVHSDDHDEHLAEKCFKEYCRYDCSDMKYNKDQKAVGNSQDNPRGIWERGPYGHWYNTKTGAKDGLWMEDEQGEWNKVPEEECKGHWQQTKKGLWVRAPEEDAGGSDGKWERSNTGEWFKVNKDGNIYTIKDGWWMLDRNNVYYSVEKGPDAGLWAKKKGKDGQDLWYQVDEQDAKGKFVQDADGKWSRVPDT